MKSIHNYANSSNSHEIRLHLVFSLIRSIEWMDWAEWMGNSWKLFQMLSANMHTVCVYTVQCLLYESVQTKCANKMWKHLKIAHWISGKGKEVEKSTTTENSCVNEVVWFVCGRDLERIVFDADLDEIHFHAHIRTRTRTYT